MPDGGRAAEQVLSTQEKVARATDLLDQAVNLLREVMTDVRSETEDSPDATTLPGPR